MTENPVAQNRLLEDLGPSRRSIGEKERLPFLSPQESVLLGERISALRREIGPKLADSIDSGETPIPKDLAPKFDEYRSLANQLAEGNIGLTTFCLERYPSMTDLPECDRDDIVGNARETLVHCSRRYDPWHGISDTDVKYETITPIKFSTYFLDMQFYSMIKELQGLHDLHIPVYQWSKYSKFRRASAFVASRYGQSSKDLVMVTTELTEKLKRPPTEEELKDYYLKKSSDWEAARKHVEMRRRYDHLLMMLSVKSFDQDFTSRRQIRDDNGEISHVVTSYETVVASETSVEDEAANNLLCECVNNILQILPPREEKILRLYYLSDMEYTLEDVAQRFGLTRSRVWQIMNQALSRLRHPSIRNQLRDYLAF